MTRRRRTAIPNGTIAWEDQGRGAAVILLHGFSFDRSMWDPQVEALSRSYRVLRYDLRGFGESTPPSAPYSHTDDLAFLLDSCELDRVVLIGLSLGANIALEFASLFPDRIHHMVLASPGLPGHVWAEERPPDQVSRIARESGVEVAKIFWATHPIFASLVDSGRAGPLLAMIERYHGWHWRNDDPRAVPADLATRLPHIDVPTLVVSGGKDAIGYREIALRIADDMPRAEIAVIPDAGHVMSLEDPETFNALVLRFLDESL